MTRIVLVGDVMVDVVARMSGPLAIGSDAPVEVSFGGGGSAANVAAWLAAAGASPVLVGRVGDDERGAAAAEELRSAGVDARLVVAEERPTGVCIVLVGPGGERSMLPDPGANAALAPDDLPGDLFAAGGHLHVTGYSLARPGPRAAALAAIERAGTAGMSVSVDPSSTALLGPDFLDLAAGAGVLLPNAEEACALAGSGEPGGAESGGAESGAARARTAGPSAAALALAARFPEVVVKLGAEGALWTDGSDEVRVPAAALPAPAALDTTGAGDAFAAGLLAARMGGAKPRAALTAACELAARAVATPGARPATPA